ncbi:MAG TPA: undecaprenyl-diphosphate phosphatase [Candidatus Acidoferrales bacterium]|jgi:undecaprenyl-diphosphatase|nr:undecaprenyl-diphosphate phosphatase [Candidatus Acidoferrales bacterium]
MTVFHAIVLAIVQGLTEFLPISSSAHLWFFPWALHWPDGGLPFDVALHAGTLIAVVLFFLGTWVELILDGLGLHYPARATPEQVQMNRRLFWLLVIGTIPGGIVGYLFEHFIEETWRNPGPIAAATIAVGLLMWVADSVSGLRRKLEHANLEDAVVIGSAQALALFPGVSRSGITIIAGLWRKMTRETAARFSFLLSTPLIAGAALKEVPQLLRMHRYGGVDLPLSTLLIAIAVSAISGYAVIGFLLRYLQTRTLKIFVVYRIVFGIVILLLMFLHR